MRLVRICGCLLFLLVVACKKDEVDIRTPEESLTSSMAARWNFVKVDRVLHDQNGDVVDDGTWGGTTAGVPGDYMAFTADGKMEYLITNMYPEGQAYVGHGTYNIISENEFDMNVDGFGISHCRVDTLEGNKFIFTDRFFQGNGRYAVSKYYLSK
ncbi:MAG: hypothetical protein INR69_17535 [Mucilaginibacter polytrichastri]|nr:hypothetical protein [Mucilaginibacter polytrichastri]